MLGTVHTGGESLQGGLKDVQTCGMTLALAYVLYHLSATWSQLQIRGRCYESRPLELDNEVTLYRVYTRELDGKLYTE